MVGFNCRLIQITVQYDNYSRNYRLTPSRSKVGRALGRRSSSYVKRASESKKNHRQFVDYIRSVCKEEIKALCSDSVLLKTAKDNLVSFDFQRIMADLREKAPVISEILASCVPVKSNLSRDVITAVCVGILCKARRPSACLLQQLCSIFLYTGHAGKQV